MFDLWLATLVLGPFAFTGVSSYLSWRRLAYPKLYSVIGVVGLWGIAFAVAYRVLGNIGIAGGASSRVLDGAGFLGVSLLIFVLLAVAFLLALRFLMLKRAVAPGLE